MQLSLRPEYSKESRYFFLPILVAVTVVLFPFSTTKVDFRTVFEHGMHVSLSKSSPAYAAFEDIKESYIDKFEIPNSGEQLKSGEALPVQRNVLQQKLVFINEIKVRNPQPEIQIESPALSEKIASIYRDETLYKDETPNNQTSVLASRLLATQPTAIKNSAQIVNPTPQDKSASAVAGTPALLARQTSAINSDNESGVEAGAELIPNTNADPARSLWLTGQVEMTGGLAFVGSETQLIVKRVVDGTTYEKGRVWVTEGRFEIRVKKPAGLLVAELVTRQGQVLGRGEMNLINLREIPNKKGNLIQDLRLALRPAIDGVTHRTLSGLEDGIVQAPSQVEIQNHQPPQAVDSEGLVSDSTLDRDSSFVSRATSLDHWPSLVVGQGRDIQNIRLFPTKMVKALIKETVPKNDWAVAERKAVVWGLVSENGKAQAGYKVEMAGYPNVVYFNEQYLPDFKLQQTSSNGIFAIVMVERGVQALRAKAGSKLLPAQIFPTEDRHISFVEVKIRNRAIAKMSIYDAKNKTRNLDATLKLVGQEDLLPIEGENLIRYSGAQGPFLVEASAGEEFVTSRMTIIGEPERIDIPMIQKNWLESLIFAKKELRLIDRGIVVGFVENQDFEVEMTGYLPHERPQVIYFDSQRKVIESKTGVAGGGFVILNAPSGLQTVFVHPLKARQSFAQVVVAEPDLVQVMSWAP